jgi:putative SbcD/Mre11-related phosphoesterase
VPVQPIPGEPAAVAKCGEERMLTVADYHAGLELSLRREGVELRSRATERRESVLALLDRTDADRVLFLGDVTSSIGAPNDAEAREVRELLTALTRRVPVTVTKGNHDGDIEDAIDEVRERHAVTVVDGPGTRIGSVGFAHGHTWPARELLDAETLCVAHEHPVVRLEDDVGGARMERVWLRGRVTPEAFTEQYDDPPDSAPDLVVFPGFNDLSGGTWVNVDGQSFLSPFLADGLADGEAYLLDGARLGDYRRV